MTARRAVHLFGAYRGPVALVCGLIIVTAVIGMAPAFLLRDLLDNVLSAGRTSTRRGSTCWSPAWSPCRS